MKHILLTILLVTTAALNYLYTTFGAQGNMAHAVMMAESAGDEYAVSQTGDYGLMQINLSAHWDEIPGNYAVDKVIWLINPYHNIDEAKRIYDDAGWGAWATYLNSSYQQFL